MQILNVPSGKPLSWYLDYELEVLQHINDYPDGAFFTWIVAPSVIYGRHQIKEQEVNIPYCEQNGIAVFQRKSGGGCVYADEGNIMLSHITPSTHAEQVFQQFLNTLASALQSMGLNAVTTAHNDILVDGYKVSGNACYTQQQGTIVHGTLLYDVDLNRMQHAITPSAEKLEKHGIQSVRQRVCNIKPLIQTSVRQLTDQISDFRFQISELFCQSLTNYSSL